jgi:prolyl oligopeptidase PreP (S9A serine peptidase family)
MSKKRRRKSKKSVSLTSVSTTENTERRENEYNFVIIKKNVNQLWRWDTLEDVK